jgi:menaquinone-specific isochorismate synthase
MKDRIAAKGGLQIAPNEYHPRVAGRLISYSRRAPGLEPLHFLRKAQGRERFFWHDGRSGLALAGMGVAAELMGWGEARTKAIERQAASLFRHAHVVGADHPAAAPRLFGGFAFREDFVPDVTWTGFGPGHFILPHIQLVHDGSDSWLTINALAPPEDGPEESLPQLEDALDAWFDALQDETEPPGDEPPGEATIRYPMDYPTWEGMIDRALAQFAATPLEKVVLSRVCEVQRPERIALVPALARLLARYPECFVFLFEPRPLHAFFGATPELLIQMEGARYESMGLAGSIQRGADPAEDDRLAAALLASAKDRREHELVTLALRARLALVSSEMDIPAEPTIYRLGNIQHLYTPVHGVLANPRGVLPMVDLLHPTPALGGTPRNIALPFIREVEPVPRGWYAAPVGWIDQNMDGTFAVAIRSAVVQRNRAWLYAGAGIVADSVAEQEWEETGWKFRPMQQALGVEAR